MQCDHPNEQDLTFYTTPINKINDLLIPVDNVGIIIHVLRPTKSLDIKIIMKLVNFGNMTCLFLFCSARSN